ncbi:MAG: hypothetical protein EAX96_17555 [Candidatus Lokiarchaeota archaeon]|nr:hypothetical protein [Candidatus Lokiarchaeota archaeon]
MLKEIQDMSLTYLKQNLLEDLKPIFINRFQKRLLILFLSSILMEDGPVSQDRLMVLSKYKKSVVSETTMNLQRTGLIKTIKIPFQRKKYYVTTTSLAETYTKILIDIPHNIIQDTFFLDLFIQYLNESNEFKNNQDTVNFLDYLLVFKKSIHLILRIFENLDKSLEQWIQSKKQQKIVKNEHFSLNKHLISDLTIKQMTPFEIPKTISREYKTLDELKNIYLTFLRNYFIKTEKNPIIGLILNILYFENKPITQERIISLSNFPRSNVSAALIMLENYDLIKWERTSGDLQKYYTPQLPHVDFLFLKLKSVETSILNALSIFLKYQKEIIKYDSCDEKVALDNFLSKSIDLYQFLASKIATLLSLKNELLIKPFH